MSRFPVAPLLLFLLLQPILHAEETPRLARIREALASVSQPVRIVCFGDSVTGIYYHSGGRSSYPELLAEALAQRFPSGELEVVNAGRSGHTSTNGLARIAQDVIVHRPHLVTVMFGLNDVAKSSLPLYRKDLGEIVRRCRAAGAEVVLCTPNAVDETEARPIAEVAAFAETARILAKDLGLPLCDVHASFESMRIESPEEWSLSMNDEIHPNLRGHRRIAEALLSLISGEAAKLPDGPVPTAPLRFTLEALKSGRAVRVLAMPPADALVADALKAAVPGIAVELVAWPVDGLDGPALVKDAARRARSLAPDLVVVSPPRRTMREGDPDLLHQQKWIVCNSMSRGAREWDVVRVHPAVFEPEVGATSARADSMVRSLASAQDIGLIDRAEGETKPGADLFHQWFLDRIREADAGRP